MTQQESEMTINISNAVSERGKVKYTVHTKTTLPEFVKKETTVVRDHDEFTWLHNSLEDNEDYAGHIIPPAPPRPDFDLSHEKLQKLGENENNMDRVEFRKLKEDLEEEYLATFKKTVAVHEMFLTRLAAHPVFRTDSNLRYFLECEGGMGVHGRSKKEIASSFFKRFTQSVDEVLLSGQKDVDDFFEHERHYLLEYHTHIKDTAAKADRVCCLRKNVADSYGKIALSLEKVGLLEAAGGDKEFGKFIAKVTDTLEKLKKAEARVGTDEELKEADTLRYFMRETQAGKDLLYRRMRRLANYEAANKNLERARARNRDIPKAEEEQAAACTKFEDISTLAKEELRNLNERRMEAYSENLAGLAELEVKMSRKKLSIVQDAVAALKEM